MRAKNNTLYTFPNICMYMNTKKGFLAIVRKSLKCANKNSINDAFLNYYPISEFDKQQASFIEINCILKFNMARLQHLSFILLS